LRAPELLAIPLTNSLKPFSPRPTSPCGGRKINKVKNVYNIIINHFVAILSAKAEAKTSPYLSIEPLTTSSTKLKPLTTKLKPVATYKESVPE